MYDIITICVHVFTNLTKCTQYSIFKKNSMVYLRKAVVYTKFKVGIFMRQKLVHLWEKSKYIYVKRVGIFLNIDSIFILEVSIFINLVSIFKF